MLDLRNLAVALHSKYLGSQQMAPPQTSSSPNPLPEDSQESTISPQFLRPIDVTSGKAVISLQDMINTTVALKSNLDVEVIQPSSQWPHSLFQTNSIPTSQRPSPQPLQQSQPSSDEDQNAAHVAQAISGLQREVLLLRNDLNFELWLSRENSKHIGRLYQDRILMKTAEAERQGLVCRSFVRPCRISHDAIHSTTNYENTDSKSSHSKESCGNTNNRHQLRRTSTLTGIRSCKRS